MKKWMLFLLIPMLVIEALGILTRFILNIDIGEIFLRNVINFIVYFIGGTIIYHLSPNKSKNLAYGYATLLTISFFYIGISTDGYVYELMGETLYHEFSMIKETVRSLAVFIGIASAIKTNNKENTDSDMSQ
ncbi:hypothetical protein [Xenorhabdus sp. KJ12.1]|uniref:hypothetical protein n=1 Tax=Xenorhabdus sp. KJ12.1 TaxID=1851571 RepID=UPI000C046832|nr:hypothetical protein [Xenorhabdus sp. KJ12.1]PHM72379.1 hypothetical protein Xekj_00658 [Xenorhabdus sp. KJ12.1]